MGSLSVLFFATRLVNCDASILVRCQAHCSKGQRRAVFIIGCNQSITTTLPRTTMAVPVALGSIVIIYLLLDIMVPMVLLSQILQID